MHETLNSSTPYVTSIAFFLSPGYTCSAVPICVEDQIKVSAVLKYNLIGTPEEREAAEASALQLYQHFGNQTFTNLIFGTTTLTATKTTVSFGDTRLEFTTGVPV